MAKALGEIERGAERRLQAKRVEFERLQQELDEGRKIVGHVEKTEAEEAAAQAQEVEIVQVEEDTTAEAETMETTGR